MLRQATIKKCKQSDIDPDRPKSEQVWCLYTKHKPERLLGRHPSREKAINQERAIKSRTGAAETPVTKDHPKLAAGIIFLCQGRVLLVRRHREEENKGEWGIPGGHARLFKPQRMPEQTWSAAKREAKEELGSLPPGIRRATRRHTYRERRTGKTFVTYVVELPPDAMQWTPILSAEHDGWQWVNKPQAKKLNLHPNVKRVLRSEQVWEGPYSYMQTIPLERDANVSDYLREEVDRIRSVNAAAKAVYACMAKDLRFVRLELSEVLNSFHTPIPVAGVAGVLRTPSKEHYFQVSVSPKEDGGLRVLLTGRKGWKRLLGCLRQNGQSCQRGQ